MQRRRSSLEVEDRREGELRTKLQQNRHGVVEGGLDFIVEDIARGVACRERDGGREVRRRNLRAELGARDGDAEDELHGAYGLDEVLLDCGCECVAVSGGAETVRGALGLQVP